MYSFFFGLLSGNSNVLRVSKRILNTCIPLMQLLKKISNKKKFRHLQINNQIVMYDHNDEINQLYSIQSDVRVIWGGDETIKKFKKYDSKIQNVDIVFPDRYSISLLHLSKKISKIEIENLAKNFYKDAYFMDQNACSSPHLILWIEGEKAISAKKYFWECVGKVAKKNYFMNFSDSFKKYSHYANNSTYLKKVNNFMNIDNSLYVVSLPPSLRYFSNLRGIFGTFYQIDINNLNILKRIVNKKYQTLSYGGLVSKKSVLDFIKNNNMDGIDRIVPLGSSHNMSFFWDGKDIIRLLSRYIEIK